MSIYSVKLFDQFLQQHRALAEKINSLPPTEAFGNPAYYAAVSDLSHQQAKQIHAMLLSVDEQEERAIIESLHAHPLHQQIILQSAFIRDALAKPYGYAGDKDLMLMICQNLDQGDSNYAILKNRVYLELPAAEAVRQRVMSMSQKLQGVPKGSRILNLACGPALEVAQLFDEFPNHGLSFDLVDHDIHTVRYVNEHLKFQQIRVLLGNALQIIKGNFQVASPREWLPYQYATPNDFRTYRKIFAPLKYRTSILPRNHYDLVYSMGLFDYIRSYPETPQKGTSGLTSQLFDLVKPGGQLIIGNYLTESTDNPHRGHHRTMMKVFSEWELLYRTHEEIMAFASEIPASQYEANLLNEHFVDYSTDRNGVIAFLILTKKVLTKKGEC